MTATKRCKGKDIAAELLYCMHVSLYAGFCAVNILRKFGILSGLSSAPFDLSILKLMSEVDDSGSDLYGDSQTKAKWILNMVTLFSVKHLPLYKGPLSIMHTSI